jgi:hypothetical protein
MNSIPKRGLLHPPRLQRAMANSALVTRIRRARWWRSGASHVLAFVAGIALAMAFAPRATQFVTLLLAAPRPAATS